MQYVDFSRGETKAVIRLKTVSACQLLEVNCEPCFSLVFLQPDDEEEEEEESADKKEGEGEKADSKKGDKKNGALPMH